MVSYDKKGVKKASLNYVIILLAVIPILTLSTMKLIYNSYLEQNMIVRNVNEINLDYSKIELAEMYAKEYYKDRLLSEVQNIQTDYNYDIEGYFYVYEIENGQVRVETDNLVSIINGYYLEPIYENYDCIIDEKPSICSNYIDDIIREGNLEVKRWHL